MLTLFFNLKIDTLISKFSGVNLILQLEKKTLSEYASLLHEKFQQKINYELLLVYLFYKRNYFIDKIIEEGIIQLDENDFDNLFTLNLTERKDLINFWRSSDSIYFSSKINSSRFHVNYRDEVISLVRSYNNGCINLLPKKLNDKRYLPENFIPKIKSDECILFGLKPDTLFKINSIINEAGDCNYNPKTNSSNYGLIGDSENLDIQIEVDHTELLNRIESIIFSSKLNQDGELLNIISSYVNENDKKTEFSFIEDINWNELNVLKNDEKLGLNPNYNGVDESIGNIPSFEFKIIESVDHNQIDLNWLNITGPIYFDDGDTSLEFDALYTDDSLSIFINVQSIEKAKSIIETIINLNRGKINFKKETVEEYILFYTGNIFTIRFRETLVGIFQVDIISNEVLNK